MNTSTTFKLTLNLRDPVGGSAYRTPKKEQNETLVNVAFTSPTPKLLGLNLATQGSVAAPVDKIATSSASNVVILAVIASAGQPQLIELRWNWCRTSSRSD